MIRSFVEMMLGDFGTQILNFYEANACLFNSIILTYGLFMLLAWNNLVRSYRFLVVEVAKKIHLDEELTRKSTNKSVRDSVEIPWDQVVSASPFPFIARVGGLLPKRVSVENLKNFFDDKEIVDAAFRMLKGENIKRITPSSRRMIQRERERKQEAARKKQEKSK